MNFPRRVALMAAVLLVSGSATFGQPQQNPTPTQTTNSANVQPPFGRRPSRGFRRDHGPGGFGPKVWQQLNLTDTQRQQISTIMQQSFESTKAQRLELRQLGDKRTQGTLTADDEARARTLHQQLRSTMKDNEVKIEALLTTDQKNKLYELREARKEGFGKRRDRFGPRPGSPPLNGAPVAKPTPQP